MFVLMKSDMGGFFLPRIHGFLSDRRFKWIVWMRRIVASLFLFVLLAQKAFIDKDLLYKTAYFYSLKMMLCYTMMKKQGSRRKLFKKTWTW
jgi:hypothetical protein